MNPVATNTPAFRQAVPLSDTPVASSSKFSGKNVTSSRGNTILNRLKSFTGYNLLTSLFHNFKSVLGRKITLPQKIVPEYCKVAHDTKGRSHNNTSKASNKEDRYLFNILEQSVKYPFQKFIIKGGKYDGFSNT
ncbi:MAG: hypothetical protein PUP46_01985 [Endozoicomonas sp. (ex Botrylloides leachii)]|nr:hypothetical protein [Endozoicomonas sp. (ex Botrylloides leachii)]